MKKSVRKSEKYGKNGRGTTFFPVKKLPKGAKIWFYGQFCFSREKKHCDWVNLCCRLESGGMNFDFTPYTWIVKNLLPNLSSFLFDYRSKNVFPILNWKYYVPEFYTIYMSFQICVAICGMKCRLCTNNIPSVSSANARPKFEYRSQSPADTVVVLLEIYFCHEKPS